MADMFTLQTPKGELVRIKTESGEVKMEIRWNPGFGPDMTERINGVQAYIDSKCLEYCDPLVPKDTGILKQSGSMNTQIGKGEVKYRTPYARRWYYMPAKYNWNQNEFDALVSFAFNIGSIDQLTAKGTRDRATIAAKLLEYTKSGGKVLPGLLKRRKEEQALFLTPVNTGGQMKPEQSHSSILKAGSKGEAVKQLQQKLAIIGYAPGPADGSFGAKTKAAVTAFQKDAGLTQDGIVGAKTLAELDEIKIYSLKADGNKAISANFKVKEFACKDKSDTIVLHGSFIRDKLQKIRSHFNAAVTFNSAYRTPEHNRKPDVGGAKDSFHVKGRAFDIVVKGKTPAEVARYAASIGIKGIIQYNSFVHVDSRAVKYWAKKINGKETSVAGF